MVRWKRGENELIGVFHYPVGFHDGANPRPPARVRLTWGEPRAVHVLLLEGSPGRPRLEAIDLEVPAGRAAFVILSPEPMDPVRLSVDESVRQGGMLSARLETKTKLARPVWLRGVMPDGEEAMWINKVLMIEGGDASVEIPLAHNERPGTWRLRAVDWFTGSTVEATYEVR